MASPKRNYSVKTIKILFAASGNQCAEPDCTNPIVAAGSSDSDPAVVAQICHIYAAADNGPRGKPGLTKAQRNAPENLLLLCGHHHPIIDKQYETYPAELLLHWKQQHESKYTQNAAELEKRIASIPQYAYLQSMTDREIEQGVETLRKSRHFSGFPIKVQASELSNRVASSELATGSRDVRARALAWCVRFLAYPDCIDLARKMLEKSKSLGGCTEAAIAEAFITSNTDKSGALRALAQIDTPAARSAALRLVTSHDKAEAAIEWVKQCQLDLHSFDPEGRFTLIMNELNARNWDSAKTHANQLLESDFIDTPVLHHATALAFLVHAIPEELRTFVLSQVPFEASSFPLASDADALALRRKAISHFMKSDDSAKSLGAASAANMYADYALWLQLRDPAQRELGLASLRASMRDRSTSLRRVHFALQFGIPLDVGTIEKEIDRRVALSGGGSGDEAIARLALAFSHGNPGAVADYIGKYRDQLVQVLDPTMIQVLEIELLARAGRTSSAIERLDAVRIEGLGDPEEQHLRRMIVEASGADPVAERKKLFDRTNKLQDLQNLVLALEEQKSWQELCLYSELLFQRTQSLEDCVRVAKAFNESQQYSSLSEFLAKNSDFIPQSIALQTVWAWTLYRDGDFSRSTQILLPLITSRNDENDRALTVNLAIGSGNWGQLIEFTNKEWNQRDARTSGELLSAGQLAQAVNAPHSRDLITAAAEKGLDDPSILAACYFHAARAGWESSASVSTWLTRAASLSGADGPLKTVNIEDLANQKPEWDKQANSAWKSLNESQIPIFAAAHLLNRSLIDLTLLRALANSKESDPRRRGIVYAYSGARPNLELPQLNHLAIDLTVIFSLSRLGLFQKVVDSYNELSIPHSTMGWLFQEQQRISFHQPSRIKIAHDIRDIISNGGIHILREAEDFNENLVKEVGYELAALLTVAHTKSKTGTKCFVVRSPPIHRSNSLMKEEADLSQYASYICGCGSVIARLRRSGVLTRPEEHEALAFLRLRESSWPQEPEIPDNAELYLSSLSVTYLQTIGVLGKFKEAGIKVFLLEDEQANANAFIGMESLSAELLNIIESVRATISSGISSGRIKVAKSADHGEHFGIKLHPTIGVLEIGAKNVDALVVDDRFVNANLFMANGDHQVPIITSLDVLDDLRKRKLIADEEFYAYRISLRQSGFQFIGVTSDELDYHLSDASVVNGQISETAELRAIRESLLLARMNKTVQIPSEVPRLNQSMMSITASLKRTWQEDFDLDRAIAGSRWLFSLLDLRGWTPSVVAGSERSFALYTYASHVLNLATPSDTISDVARDAYCDWIGDEVLAQVEDEEPEMFEWIIERSRFLIDETARHAVERYKR